MALKLVLCLLFVVGVFSQTRNPSVRTEPPPEVIEGTTVPSTTGGTTVPPTTGGTTVPPTTEGTTVPPTTGGTTVPPTTEGTTVPPTTGGTTVPPTTGGTTVPPTTGGTTVPPTTGGTTVPPPTGGTTVPPTTTTPSPCASSPCGGGSTCHDRADESFVCLCLAGDYYDGTQKQCIRGKAFPGDINYNTPYDQKMADTKSAEFKKTADEIVGKLDPAFKKLDVKYRNSVVTKISEGTARKAGIIATVEINFESDSLVTKKEIDKAVQDNVGEFTAIPLCDTNACDITADCMNEEGTFTCKCKDKYISTDFSDRICVACPNNMKAVNNICVACDFGYTGVNCEDNWQLILVIVGSVLGCLLLVTIILLPVVALKTKKKSKKGKATEANDYAKPKLNPAPVKALQVSNGSAVPRPTPVQAAPAGGRAGFGGNGVPRIPRATANESWDRSNLEMVPSNSRQNLIPAGRNSRRFDDDDSNPYSRPSKPQNNPYAMARPQVNPYGSSQGNSNPYYRN